MAEWIEINNRIYKNLNLWSPLAMAEWIEIAIGAGIGLVFMVSASDGGVD